jgi:hypothetical protein
MCVGDALRELAAFLDGCEEETLVNAVGLVERDHEGGARELTAEVELCVPLCGSADEPGLRTDTVTVNDERRLVVTFESVEPVVPEPEGRVSVDSTDVSVRSDGTLGVILRASVPTDEEAAEPTTDGGSRTGDRRTDGATADRTKPSRGHPARDRDVPPFRDPELLAEVYESCDTFAEMTDAIGMDVTSETVRRYMIDYGIHQPNSYDTGGDTGADDGRAEANDELELETVGEDSPVVLADGIGLPEGVTVETLIEAVERSNTLYEVGRAIGVDRTEALEMLRQLDLIDLVVGRLSTEHERDIDREDVVERLRRVSAAG